MIFLWRLFRLPRGGESSSQLSVLLPANALPQSRSRKRFCRLGSRLPTSTASGASCDDHRSCLDFSEQRCPGIGGDDTAVKAPAGISRLEGQKIEKFRVALCLYWVASCMCHNLLSEEQVIAYKAARRNTTGEKRRLARNVRQRSSTDFVPVPGEDRLDTSPTTVPFE